MTIVALGVFASFRLEKFFLRGRLEPIRVARQARERVRCLERELTGHTTEEPPWQFGHLGTGLQEWVGTIEIIIYASSVVYGKPEFIAVWFGTKYVASYRTWAKEPVGRTFYNRSLFGSGLNIVIGFFTGRLALWLISLDSDRHIVGRQEKTITHISSSFWKMLTPEWLTAIGTVGAVVLALLIALWGQWLGQLFFHPALELDARVQRPDSDLVRRWARSGSQVIDLGESYYFRIAITNKGSTPARDVQVFLAGVERENRGSKEMVSRFTPMNLIWTNTGEMEAKDRVTRHVLLADTPPVYCDLAHVDDPKFRKISGQDLEEVPANKAVLGLDVRVPTYSKGHLLEPGTYRFSLTLAASNCPSTHHILKVSFLGDWLPEKEMFDTGFKMEKL